MEQDGILLIAGEIRPRTHRLNLKKTFNELQALISELQLDITLFRKKKDR